MEFKEGSVIESVGHEVIKNFESDYNVKLPVKYVEFLSYGNCGIPITDNTFFLDRRERMIERFLCISDAYDSESSKEVYDIGVVESQIGERLTDRTDTVGMDVVPIAALFGGDFVCLDYRESKDSPKVVVWDHEQSDEFSPVTELVANSFDEFLELLKRH